MPLAVTEITDLPIVSLKEVLWNSKVQCDIIVDFCLLKESILKVTEESNLEQTTCVVSITWDLFTFNNGCIYP